jgi:predicted nucleotidyltransferase
MNRRHGLSAKTVAQITGVLASFPEVERAVLFGSRAKGTQKPGSDIDLALVGEALGWRTIGNLYDALDDLLLPYRFSLILFDSTTDPDVTAHIARVGVVLFQREPSNGIVPAREAAAKN